MNEQGNIARYTRESYENFCAIRGKQKEEFSVTFWDLVVLTTADEDQKIAFDLQIEQKLKQKEIPLGVPYHVFPDPPGPKAGCGTSTMNICCKLRELYGEKLDSYRILLINCGGQSQRLPSASILGKVFMALPLGFPSLSLFEYKLFCYLPFLQRMSPGYLHVASDTIEVFDLGENTDWSFERPGFTAAAHPSSLEIGATHGVYVLKESINGKEELTEMRDCLRVLQKPSVEKMRQSRAVLTKSDNGTMSEFVYTDSFFYFDQNIARKFERFYQAEAPFECEIDGYADYLQSLGPQATIDFTRDLRNVGTVEPRLLEMREKIFHLLKGTPLHIVGLNCSKFYHLGTMNEYIYNFCEDDVFRAEMGFTLQAFCKLVQGIEDLHTTPHQMSGCQIHSIMSQNSHICQRTIVEFCNFPCKLNIGSDCIISSCKATPTMVIDIPSNTFMHTVAVHLPFVKNIKPVLYATVVFHLHDNMKIKSDISNFETLPYLGTTLAEFAKFTMLDKSELFDDDCQTYNLWFAKLFPVYDSMEAAMQCSMDVIHAVRKKEICSLQGQSFVSMRDILKWKDAGAMLNYREQLYRDIIGA